MDESLIILLLLIVGGAILSGIVLPIIALVISIRSRRKFADQISRLEAAQASLGSGALQQPPSKSEAHLTDAIRQLEDRIRKLEEQIAAPRVPVAEGVQGDVKQATRQSDAPPSAGPTPMVETPTESPKPSQPPAQPYPDEPPPLVVPTFSSIGPDRAMQAQQIESIIGRRWLGWAAVILILFAAAFFLKYAFENRWIGELGRVAIGVAAGVSMTALGLKYHKRGWRVFSQILTSGGVVLLYLSVYAAFGYYHLATQKAAFVYLAILVAEAAGLAFFYDAPAIAIMALLGGFLAPILLRSDRDQYRSLFGYIAALDVGALALLKHWPGLSSLAFGGTHLLFWMWYDENYHPRKLAVVMIFQTAVFLIFLLAQVGRDLVRRAAATLEDLALLIVNPFVFFATAYHLLNPDHHDWMGVFAVGMGLLYAGSAKILLSRIKTTQSQLLCLIGVSLTFVTLAIPIQLKSNWITIGWSVEGLAILWVGIQTRTQRLRALAGVVFAFALVRLLLWDTQIDSRPTFTPVLNKYFLSSMVVAACLFAASALYQDLDKQKQISVPPLRLVILLVAIATLWFVMSVETHTFFEARAAAQRAAEDAHHDRWMGQMALSVLWSVYAGALAAAGFIRRSAGVRWASLALFAFTVIKVMLVDIAGLQQLYRIVAFLVLGVLLLVVAWGYQKAFHSRESSK